MIQTLANKITEQLFENGEAKEIFEIHKYGIEVMISTILNFLLLVMIGYVSSHLIDACLYFLLFGFIRKLSGGYHCSTYFKCISLFIFYVLTYQYYTNLKIIIFILTVIVFMCLSSINMRELNNKELKLYKIISLLIVGSLILLSFIIIYDEIIIYVLFVVSILMLVCIKEK